MSYKVFLSYARNDSAFAELVKAKIKDWLPHHRTEVIEFSNPQPELATGADVRQSIRSAIQEAGTVVVISSESSDLSPWVNYEAGLADALGK